MEQGEAAVKRLAEIDGNRGMQSTESLAKNMRDRNTPPVVEAADGLLSDNLLAKNLRNQASKMEAEAKLLLTESQRLQQEASSLDGIAVQYASADATPVAKKRGRPAKVKTLA